MLLCGWRRVPLWLKIVAPIGAIVVGYVVVTGLDQTLWSDLERGDCFEEPSDVEFRYLDDQDCGSRHDSEVIAIIEVPSDTEWPGDLGAVDASARIERLCWASLNGAAVNDHNLPPDAFMSYLFADERRWNRGDRDVICYIHSPSGLPGPVLADG